MKTFFKKRIVSYGIAFAVAVLVHLLVQHKYGYLFAVNDDMFYRALCNGTLTGDYETKLIYISNVLGMVFKGLYWLCGSIEWYSLFLILAHYITWVLLAGEIGSMLKKSWQKCSVSLLVMIACIAVDLERTVMSTFTSTAACFSVIGIIFLAMFLFKVQTCGYGIIAVIGCVIGFLTRHEVFLSFLPLMAIVVVLFFAVNSKNFKPCIKMLLPYTIALGTIVGATYIFESITYSSPEWKEYLAFNDARTIAHDYCDVPDYNNNQDAYTNIGWQYDDFFMMKYAGPGIFDDLDSSKMYEYAEIAKTDYRWQLQWKKNALIRFLEDYCNNENSALKMMALGLCISLGVFFACRKSILGLSGVMLGSFYHVLYGTFLIYKGRFPERICHIILLAVIVFYLILYFIRDTLYIEETENGDKDSNIFICLKYAALCAGMGICILLARNNLNDSYKTVINRVSNLILLRTYCNNNPDNVYCIEGSIYGAYSDFAFGEGNPDNLIVVGSWLPKSPHHKAWSDRLGLVTIQTSLAEAENVYLIRQTEESDEVIVDFYADYNKRTIVNVVDVLPGDFAKVVKISEEK